MRSEAPALPLDLLPPNAHSSCRFRSLGVSLLWVNGPCRRSSAVSSSGFRPLSPGRLAPSEITTTTAGTGSASSKPAHGSRTNTGAEYSVSSWWKSNNPSRSAPTVGFRRSLPWWTGHRRRRSGPGGPRIGRPSLRLGRALISLVPRRIFLDQPPAGIPGLGRRRGPNPRRGS